MENKKFKAIKNINDANTDIEIGNIIEIVGYDNDSNCYLYHFIEPKIDFLDGLIYTGYVDDKNFFINIIEERDKKLNEILK